MRRATGRLTAWLAVAIGAALVAPSVRPLDPTLNPPGEALPFGCLAGASAFVLLARRRIDAMWFSRLPRGASSRAVAVLARSRRRRKRSGGLCCSACSSRSGAPGRSP